MYSCIIVDDDDLDRLAIEFYVKESKLFTHIQCFQSVYAATEAIHKQAPDVLFLDIDMPGISGLDFRKKHMDVPVCVFVSSHGEYALNAFEMKASDFIQKPVKAERFAKTKAVLAESLRNRTKSQLFDLYTNNKTIIVKGTHQTLQLQPFDILYLEAMKNSTKIVEKLAEHVIPKGISDLMSDEGFENFVRIHKSYAIQKKAVRKIVSGKIMLENDQVLPIGRKYKENLNQLL